MNHKVTDALEALTSATALLTEAIGTLGEQPIAVLEPRLDSVQRALSRMTVLTAMDPTCSQWADAPRHAIPGDELAEWSRQAAELDALVAIPAGPVAIRVHATAPAGASGDTWSVCSVLDQRILMAQPASDVGTATHAVEIGHLIEAALEQTRPQPFEW